MTFKFLGKNRYLRSSLTSILNYNEKCIAAATEVSSVTLSLETKTDVAFPSSDPPKRMGSISQLPSIRKPECGFIIMHHCQNIATLRDAQSMQCKNEYNTSSMQTQIVDALRFDEKARAFDLLLHLGHSLRTDDFVHILEHCARAPDPLFAWETWKIIDERKIRLNSRSCVLLLKALCQGGSLEKGFNFLCRLGEKGSSIYPSITAYNYFLGACIKLENANLAGQCLDLMENRLIGRNEATYVELLNLAVWQKNLLAVHELWLDYIKQYQINLFLVRKFVWSFKRLDDLKSAYETLQIIVSIISQSTSSSRTLEEFVYPPRLDVPIPSTKELSFKSCNLEDNVTLTGTLASPGNCKGLCMISSPTYAEVESDRKGKRTDRSLSAKDLLLRSFNDVIHACARAHEYGLAKKLVQQMNNIGVEPSSHTFGKLVQAIVRTGNFMDGMEVLKMMEKRKLKPFHSTIATLSIKCSKSLKLDLAEELLKEISRKRSKFQLVHPYNALLEACDVLNQPERALWVLKKMKNVGLQPDIKTYELLFSLFGNVNAPYEKGDMLSHENVERRMSAILMDMTKNGVPHSMTSMHNLLRALGEEGMVGKLLQYLEELENRVINPNDRHLWTPIYNTVLISLVKAREISTTFSKFRKMKLRGVPANSSTYTTMIDCCSIGGCVRLAYAFVSLMVRDGYDLQIATYTTLIKGVLEHGNFDEALNLLDQACTEGIKPDVWIFNAILYKASEKWGQVRMDVLEHTIEKMHQEKVIPNASTCWYVFEAYISSRRYGTAMEALEVLSVRMLSSPEKENVLAEYEKVIYYEGSEEAERAIVSRFLRHHEKYDDIAFALLNLRWCAILKGSPINWSSEQSWWSQRLSGKYEGIPDFISQPTQRGAPLQCYAVGKF